MLFRFSSSQDESHTTFKFQSPHPKVSMLKWPGQLRIFTGFLNVNSWSAQLFWCMIEVVLQVREVLLHPECMIMDYSRCCCCNEPNIDLLLPLKVAHADAGRCLDGGGQRWPPDIQTTHSTPRSNVSTRAAAAEKIVTFDRESLLASCFLFHHPSLKWFVCMCGLEKTLIGPQIMIELITSNSSESVLMKIDSTVRIFQSFDRPQLFMIWWNFTCHLNYLTLVI